MSLTLEDSAGATKVVGMYKRDSDTSKRPAATVYFSHDVSEEACNYAEAAGVLELHKDYLQKKNHINSQEFAEICELIDEEGEPDGHDPLRGAFWDLKDHYDRYLKREMWLGDQPEYEFRLEFPRNRETWPGSMTLFANSGGGKTFFLVGMLVRYLKSVPEHCVFVPRGNHRCFT